jgi:F420-non-reducing hydrogenase iron-sulfur subunit
MPAVELNPQDCIGCGLCSDLCLYEGAVAVREQKASIDEKYCKGCGLCVATCPGSALNIRYLARGQISARVRVLLGTTRVSEEFEPRIMIFICDWASRKGVSLDEVKKFERSSNVRASKFPCIGAVDPVLIFEAFLNGADGVLVVGCAEGDCDHKESNLNVMPRIEYAKMGLQDMGLEPERLKVDLIKLLEGRDKFSRTLKEAIETIRTLGPSPLTKQ